MPRFLAWWAFLLAKLPADLPSVSQLDAIVKL
jgi:hypothetical protein